jgi:hypothetical protein
MAHERKAGESASSLSRARSSVPTAKKDDPEDVAWALQTAEATWSRGDHGDALKWIRRAAEAASEAERDDRALELAKAAADVASLMTDRVTAVAPPPIPGGAPQRQDAAPASAGPANLGSSAASAGRVGAPMAPRVGNNAASLPRPGQKGPLPARVQAGQISKRGGRRSAPSITEETGIPSEVRSRRASITNETKKRGRLSKPAAEETVQAPPVSARQPSAEEVDAWPTASLSGDELDAAALAQNTTLGAPAYRETAEKASARPPPPSAVPLVMSQAVRVVVWRAADGVHVAPAGTHVAAIGVEAVLVALDPVADLATWLANR